LHGFSFVFVYFISTCLVSSYFISIYFISSYFISIYFISTCVVSPSSLVSSGGSRCSSMHGVPAR
jgi:hypothetical protein